MQRAAQAPKKLSYNDVLQLHRMVGNQGVEKLLQNAMQRTEGQDATQLLENQDTMQRVEDQDAMQLAKNQDVAQLLADAEVIMRKIKADAGDHGEYYAEAKLEKGGKHGIKWKEGPARSRNEGKDQGKFGSVADLQIMVDIVAQNLAPNTNGEFDLPLGHTCIVYPVEDPDNPVPATKFWAKVYRNGKVHGYPKR